MSAVADIILEMKKAGVVFMLPEDHKNYSLGTAAELLDCSTKYLREHLEDFPNAFRLTGGEIRIPRADLRAYAATRRIFLKP